MRFFGLQGAAAGGPEGGTAEEGGEGTPAAGSDAVAPDVHRP